MKSRSLLYLFAAGLSMALLPKAALADTLTITNPTLTAAGGTVAVYGTYTNTGSVLENFLGDDFTIGISGSTVNDTPYFVEAQSIAPNSSITEELFLLTVPAVSAGSYASDFVITTDGSSATGNFNVNVSGAAVTPEPSTWLLLGTGVLGMGVLLRRRNQFAGGSPAA